MMHVQNNFKFQNPDIKNLPFSANYALFLKKSTRTLAYIKKLLYLCTLFGKVKGER